MKYLCLALAVAVFASCGQKKTTEKVESIDPKVLISCEGIGQVKLTDSHADLEKKFGDSVLTEHENNLAGKFTSVWENSPEHINVYWKEKQAPFKTIRYVEAVDKMSPYMTKDSITVGMSIRDLVRKNNNMALTFKNFTSSDPGLITGFNNGDIPKTNPCFGGILEWEGQKPIDIKELRAFQARDEVKSFDQILQRMDIALGAIRLTNK
ncbi:hypothetical protein ACFSJU_16175 [Paradesertivirga mongoliensis]|uniref:Uncharacterized protein n=1 Tax=Paradesertivirga mongoliensis TaxID=2100740 RepID=A0ABW4ZQW2_9SPHI|nr:hypothetical protein [Pedobacter mongoliensis]